MQIFTGTLNGHTLRYANDNGDNFTEPDAWKYKVDNGLWSPPFDTFDAMLNAVEQERTLDNLQSLARFARQHDPAMCGECTEAEYR